MPPDAMCETILDRAVQAGKIPTARREHYREMYKRDQPGTVRLLASLAPGINSRQLQQLVASQRDHDEEVLAAARNSFPELQRRSRSAAPASPVKAGWYSRREKGQPVRKGVQPSRSVLWPSGTPAAPESAPFPQGLNV